MKTAKELYKREDDDYFEVYDYDPMLKEFGNIALQVDDDDYKGDSRVLYTDGEKVGYLNFGWGSCSGCDALQGCSSYEELQSLMDDLKASIKWFDSKAEALEYFNTKDWELEYSWHAEEQKKFIDEAKEFLSK